MHCIYVSFPVVWWILFLGVMILYMMVMMIIALLVACKYCSGDNENG